MTDRHISIALSLPPHVAGSCTHQFMTCATQKKAEPATMSAMSNSPTMTRLKPAHTLLVGLMIFGLMFGAGNLIFPVEMGRAAGNHTTLATLGFLITATGLPVLGIIASALTGSRNVRELVAPAGGAFALIFTVLLYLAIGPMLAIPRTATVSYEIGFANSIGANHQDLGLFIFTGAFFALVMAAALRPGKLIDFVGKYLTPIFLLLLGTLIVAAIFRPMRDGPLPAATDKYVSGPWAKGFIDGYSTLDALAGLAFAIVIIEAINKFGVRDRAKVAATTAKSGIFAVVAMSLVYSALAYLGATSLGEIKKADNGGAVLAGASEHFFGSFGQTLIAAIVLFACLKTAIGLVTACGEMFRDLFGSRISYPIWAGVFVLVSWGISNLGLVEIVKWSAPVLMLLYPMAIVAILLGLAAPLIGRSPWIYRLTMLFAGLVAIVDFIGALPVGVPGGKSLVQQATDVLPWYSDGFGWVIPAAIGFVIGFILSRMLKDNRDASSAPA